MTDRPDIAERYLLRLKGYEEATTIMKDRYVYAVVSGAGRRKILHQEHEFREMEAETNRIRNELFESLATMHSDKSRKVLWLLYVEGKQVDEVCAWLGLRDEIVEVLRIHGLCSLDVPGRFCEEVSRRQRR